MAYIARRRRAITTLPLTGATADQIIEDNPRRVALHLKNTGTGNVYISEQKDTIGVLDGWLLEPGEYWAPATSPIAPQNELYAVGDAGHELRIFEVVATEHGATL